jgi:hypothetical protein
MKLIFICVLVLFCVAWWSMLAVDPTPIEEVTISAGPPRYVLIEDTAPIVTVERTKPDVQSVKPEKKQETVKKSKPKKTQKKKSRCNQNVTQYQYCGNYQNYYGCCQCATTNVFYCPVGW